MRIIKKFRIRMIIGSILGIALLLVVTIFVFINQPSFGRTPRGERLERIKQSPNYRNGEFQNLGQRAVCRYFRISFPKDRRSALRPTCKCNKNRPPTSRTGQRNAGMVRAFILPDSDRRKTNTSRSGILHGFPCFFRQQTF